MKKEIKEWLNAIVPKNSKILILWTFPSEESLKEKFYYKNSSNNFWKILWEVFWTKDLESKSDDSKILFLMKYNIALWDIFEKAERINWKSSDNKTQWIECNDIKWLLADFPTIKTIIVHSKEAEEALKKYIMKKWVDISYRYVPSPSNNNTHSTYKEKVEEWKSTFKDLWLI